MPESFDSALTPAQCMAITHLMAGKSLTSVATLLNIDRKTLYNWRQLPAFRAALHSLCHEACEAAAMRIRNLLLRGTHKLAAYMEAALPFNDLLRLVANKRVWDMAQVMPQTESPTPSDEAPEPDATRESAPADTTVVEAGAAQRQRTDSKDRAVSSFDDERQAAPSAKHTSFPTTHRQNEATATIDPQAKGLRPMPVPTGGS